MSLYGDSEKWNNADIVREFLVSKMMAGNLLLCLGSGISYFAELPDWNALLGDVAKSKDPKFSLDPALDPYIQANQIRTSLFGGTPQNRQEMLSLLHRRLYRDTEESTLLQKMEQNPGMKALSMLASNSIRGGAKYVVTFNYDDILEILLRNLGIVTLSTGSHLFVLGNADVSVFHPHGLLRLSELNAEIERFAVISQDDAKNAVTKSWRQTMTFLLSKHFPLFVGLGGRDIRLLDLLDDVQEQSFLANKTRSGFFGVRLASQNDPSNSVWEDKGVKCLTFEDMPSEWPSFIQLMCQDAAKIREQQAGFLG